jgi:hypothetical protein
MTRRWSDRTQAIILLAWGLLGGLALAVGLAALMPSPAEARGNANAHLGDVVDALQDLTAEVHAVAAGVKGLERALREANR